MVRATTDAGAARRPVIRLSMDRALGQLAEEHAACARVLERYQLDYRGDGARTLRDACGDRGLDPARVLVDCERALDGVAR